MQGYGEMRTQILIALNEQSKRNSLFRNVQEVIWWMYTFKANEHSEKKQ